VCCKDEVEVVEANVQADHIHLVLSIPPKYAVSNIMGYLKGSLPFACSIAIQPCVSGTGADDYGHAGIA
jgi:hypothetical protein